MSAQTVFPQPLSSPPPPTPDPASPPGRHPVPNIPHPIVVIHSLDFFQNDATRRQRNRTPVKSKGERCHKKKKNHPVYVFANKKLLLPLHTMSRLNCGHKSPVKLRPSTEGNTVDGDRCKTNGLLADLLVRDPHLLNLSLRPPCSSPPPPLAQKPQAGQVHATWTCGLAAQGGDTSPTLLQQLSQAKCC